MKGFVKFICKHLITNNETKELGLICTDRSRGKFRFRNSNNEIVYDQLGIKFGTIIVLYGKDCIIKVVDNMRPHIEDDFGPYMNIRSQVYRFMRDGTEPEFWNQLAIHTYIEPDKRKTIVDKNQKVNIIFEEKEEKKEYKKEKKHVDIFANDEPREEDDEEILKYRRIKERKMKELEKQKKMDREKHIIGQKILDEEVKKEEEWNRRFKEQQEKKNKS
jgi:hypothetical protein